MAPFSRWQSNAAATSETETETLHPINPVIPPRQTPRGRFQTVRSNGQDFTQRRTNLTIPAG